MNDRIQIWMDQADYIRLREYLGNVANNSPLNALVVALDEAHDNNANWPLPDHPLFESGKS